LFGVLMNITPLLTSGGAWCEPGSSVLLLHTSFRRETFAGVILSSGL